MHTSILVVKNNKQYLQQQLGYSGCKIFNVLCLKLGVCAGRIGRVKANISIKSATSELEKFQSATDPPKSKSSGLVTNFGGFNLAGYAG